MGSLDAVLVLPDCVRNLKYKCLIIFFCYPSPIFPGFKHDQKVKTLYIDLH